MLFFSSFFSIFSCSLSFFLSLALFLSSSLPFFLSLKTICFPDSILLQSNKYICEKKKQKQNRLQQMQPAEPPQQQADVSQAGSKSPSQSQQQLQQTTNNINRKLNGFLNLKTPLIGYVLHLLQDTYLKSFSLVLHRVSQMMTDEWDEKNKIGTCDMCARIHFTCTHNL